MVEIRCVGRVSTAVSALALAAIAGLGAGCAGPTQRAMSPAMFMPATGVATAVPSTAPAVASDDPAVQPARDAAVPDGGASPKKAMILTPGPTPEFDSVRPLAPLQASPTTAPADAAPAPAPQPPTAEVASPPASPAAPPAEQPTGVYLTVGGVLAQVNDVPIYAHTVLALLDKEFAGRARDMDAESFHQYAAERITRQTQELILDELDFTSALKALSADDRKLVDLIASETRQDRVKQAGGSLELARRQTAAQGLDFEDLMRQEYRQVVVDMYRRRQIDPLVQVSAQDMREFYAANGAKLYGDKDRLQFRVIEVDPARMGGDQPRVAALTKIRALREKAAAGQDFAALASTQNDDDALREHGGDPGGWMDRGSYRLDAVDAALWALRPGQVTGVVEVNGVFYVAKLEDKHEGRTKPFDDPAVQEDVYKRLAQVQRIALLTRVRDTVEAEAVVTTSEDRMNTALEMAMQRYARWTGR